VAIDDLINSFDEYRHMMSRQETGRLAARVQITENDKRHAMIREYLDGSPPDNQTVPIALRPF